MNKLLHPFHSFSIPGKCFHQNYKELSMLTASQLLPSRAISATTPLATLSSGRPSLPETKMARAGLQEEEEGNVCPAKAARAEQTRSTELLSIFLLAICFFLLLDDAGAIGRKGGKERSLFSLRSLLLSPACRFPPSLPSASSASSASFSLSADSPAEFSFALALAEGVGADEAEREAERQLLSNLQNETRVEERRLRFRAREKKLERRRNRAESIQAAEAEAGRPDHQTRPERARTRRGRQTTRERLRLRRVRPFARPVPHLGRRAESHATPRALQLGRRREARDLRDSRHFGHARGARTPRGASPPPVRGGTRGRATLTPHGALNR